MNSTTHSYNPITPYKMCSFPSLNLDQIPIRIEFFKYHTSAYYETQKQNLTEINTIRKTNVLTPYFSLGSINFNTIKKGLNFW